MGDLIGRQEEGLTEPTVITTHSRTAKVQTLYQANGIAIQNNSTLGVSLTVPILAVKKNPQSRLVTDLAVFTIGAVIEVNIQELGFTPTNGKVPWGRPENNGCDDATLLI